MDAREAVTCPACGARNRSSWEYCARCDEPLDAALPVPSGGPAIQVQRAVAGGPPEGASAESTGILFVTVLAFGLLSIAAYQSASDAPPVTGPDPRMFTIGSPPANLPQAGSSTSMPPGAADFEEGRQLLAEGDPAAAVGVLTAALAADPESATYREALAQALWRAGDREGALAVRGEGARLDPGQQVQYARTLDAAGRSEDAVREYEAVLARSPDSPMVHEELGRLLYRSGSFADAAPHLETAVAHRPDDAVLRQELAFALDQRGDREEAATEYREVLARVPDAVIARSLLAENLFGRGQADEAFTLLEQGVERTPDAPLLHRGLGSILERSQRTEEAIAAYRQYLQLAPNAPDAEAIDARARWLEFKRAQ